MSDTNINQYYPQETPQTLVGGEAVDAPLNEPAPTQQIEDSLPISSNEGVVDLGIDLPDIPLPDEDPVEDSVKDLFEDAAFNFAIVDIHFSVALVIFTIFSSYLLNTNN